MKMVAVALNAAGVIVEVRGVVPMRVVGMPTMMAVSILGRRGSQIDDGQAAHDEGQQQATDDVFHDYSSRGKVFTCWAAKCDPSKEKTDRRAHPDKKCFAHPLKLENGRSP